MATTTHREGPPSPGAGLLRLTRSSRKALRLAGLAGLLVILVLTFDKTVFLFRLTGAALRSGTGGRGYFTAMAKCAYRRPGLLPLLEDEAGAPDFLAAWLAEHVRRGDSDFERIGYGPFLERVSARFPENVLLESLGIYGDGEDGRDWQAFDPLFFRLVSDPGFNSLSYPALTRAFRDGRLPPESLPPLLSYLAWMKNPALAKELREWGTGDPAMNNALSGLPAGVLPPRPTASLGPGPRGGAEGARSALARALAIDPAPLRLGENLIAGPDLSDLGSFERSWEFLDMSGRDPFAKGSFAGGLDSPAGPALRVMGFFTRAQPGRVPCRAGFGQKRASRSAPRSTSSRSGTGPSRAPSAPPSGSRQANGFPNGRSRRLEAPGAASFFSSGTRSSRSPRSSRS